jgi:hypothetical protein
MIMNGSAVSNCIASIEIDSDGIEKSENGNDCEGEGTKESEF